jgi:hypothetical protein
LAGKEGLFRINVETTLVYVHAERAIKKSAFGENDNTETAPGKFCPSDELLSFLEAL